MGGSTVQEINMFICVVLQHLGIVGIFAFLPLIHADLVWDFSALPDFDDECHGQAAKTDAGAANALKIGNAQPNRKLVPQIATPAERQDAPQGSSNCSDTSARRCC